MSQDIRAGKWDLHATAGTAPTLTTTWTQNDVAYSLVGKTVTLYVGGTVTDPTSFTGATSYAGTISTNTATFTPTIPTSTTSTPLRMTVDGVLVAIGTLTPSTTGSASPDLDVTVAVDSRSFAVSVNQSEVVQWRVNVKDYGATGDGVTDDTTAINAASAAAATDGDPLYFPAGTYIYTGTGLAPGTTFNISGAGMHLTTISLGASSYFINDTTSPSAQYSLHLTDMTINGGLGGYRNTNTAANVTYPKVFERVRFLAYTGTAVYSASTDAPYFHFRDCVFYAASFDGTIGVALAGSPDGCTFDACSFLRNRIGIKAYTGNSMYVRGCDFLRFSGARVGGGAVDIWIVPDTASTNYGHGCHIGGQSKFGAENFLAGDYRILFADADTATGDDFGDRLPDLDTASAGYVGGVSIHDALFGGSANTCPMIYSMTPNVWGIRVGPVTVIAHSGFTYVVEFYSSAIPAPDRLTFGSVLGPIFGGGLSSEGVWRIAPSNAAGIFRLNDPVGYWDTDGTQKMSEGGGSDPVGYVDLLGGTAISAFARFATVGGVAGTDAHGGTESGDFSALDATGIYRTAGLSGLVAGDTVWIELDLKSSGASPLTTVNVRLQETSNGPTHWRKYVTVPSTWQRFRFSTRLRTPAVALLPMISTTTGTGSVSIGRVRVYHAREPLAVDVRAPGRVQAGTSVRVGGESGPTVSSGTGTPEAAVTAPVGSLFLRTNGGASTTLYVKESGTGNTGWVAK